jgi:hypothetical protein
MYPPVLETTTSDNAKPWEPPEPQDPALQCGKCGYDKHDKNTNYHCIETYDIKNCCGVCRTTRLDGGDLICTFDGVESRVGHYHVCDAICRLFPWEIKNRYRP